MLCLQPIVLPCGNHFFFTVRLVGKFTAGEKENIDLMNGISSSERGELYALLVCPACFCHQWQRKRRNWRPMRSKVLATQTHHAQLPGALEPQPTSEVVTHPGRKTHKLTTSHLACVINTIPIIGKWVTSKTGQEFDTV